MFIAAKKYALKIVSLKHPKSRQALKHFKTMKERKKKTFLELLEASGYRKPFKKTTTITKTTTKSSTINNNNNAIKLQEGNVKKFVFFCYTFKLRF